MYLNRLERVLRRRLAGHQLGHGGFHRAPLDTGVLHSSQTIDKRAGRFGSTDHVCDLLLHHLEFPDGLSERAALGGVGEGQVDGALGLTDAPGGHGEPTGVERGAQNRKPAPHLAQHRLVGHDDIIEVHFGHVVAVQRSHRERPNGDTGDRRVQHKHSDPPVRLGRVDGGRDEKHTSLGRVRDKDLGPPQTPSPVNLRRPSLHRGQIRAAARLRQAG